MVVFSWAVVSFCIELFCVVTLQYQILVRIAIAYFIIEKKNAVNTVFHLRQTKNLLLSPNFPDFSLWPALQIELFYREV
jgi:hypothetical protein